MPLLAGPDGLAELQWALREVGFEGRLFIVADEHAMQLHDLPIAATCQTRRILQTGASKLTDQLQSIAQPWHFVKRCWLRLGGGHIRRGCDARWDERSPHRAHR